MEIFDTLKRVWLCIIMMGAGFVAGDLMRSPSYLVFLVSLSCALALGVVLRFSKLKFVYFSLFNISCATSLALFQELNLGSPWVEVAFVGAVIFMALAIYYAIVIRQD